MAEKKKITHICGIICVCVALLSASFCAGRYVRLGVLERDSARIDSTYAELTESLSRTESELAARIAECEQYEQRLGSISAGLNDSLGIVRQMRGDCDIAGVEASELKSLLRELRERFKCLELRSAELEKRLEEYQRSATIE